MKKNMVKGIFSVIAILYILCCCFLICTAGCNRDDDPCGPSDYVHYDCG